MIKKTRAEMQQCIIHKVANKYNSGRNSLSENLVKFDEESYEVILPFLLKPFSTVTQSYRFNLGNNKVYNYTQNIFKEDSFIENSKKLVNHLYEQSNSSQIKTGDVLVVLFEGIEYKDTLLRAVGLFKIESKLPFLQTYLEEDSFDVVVQKGISPKKLDKGFLVLEYSDGEGPIVLSVDNNNYDAQYWIKDFLNVKYADDRNLHTHTYLQMCKSFAEDVVKPFKDKQSESVFLSETVDYFKENEDINLSDFKDEVVDESLRKEFDEYIKNYEKLNDVKIQSNFEVSDEVLKKDKKKFKTEIKLDTNIKINIDIDAPDAASEYLENGYDEVKKMKYYKVYYNAEK